MSPRSTGPGGRRPWPSQSGGPKGQPGTKGDPGSLLRCSTTSPGLIRCAAKTARFWFPVLSERRRAAQRAGHLSRRYSDEGLRARHRRRRVSPRRRRHALRQARRRVRAPLVHLRRHRDNARRVAIRGPREHLACTDDNPTLIERPIELLSVPPATSPADFVEMASARQPAVCGLPAVPAPQAAKDRRSRHVGRDLREQFQPFPARAVFGTHEAGGVAARPRQAVDESGADRTLRPMAQPDIASSCWNAARRT